MKHLRTWPLLCGSIVFLAACSSTPPVAPTGTKAPPPVSTPAPAPSAPAPLQPSPIMAPQSQTTTLPAYLDPKSAISKQRSIYFGYDIFAVKPEFVQMLEAHGKFLAANPQVSIQVQGHTDERGSAEYNLALGQKRADAVVRALKIYGVKDAQMEATSFGSEKPKAMGHDEAAWSQNRRVDLDYPKN